MNDFEINLVGAPGPLQRFARALLKAPDLTVHEDSSAVPFTLSTSIGGCCLTFNYCPTPHNRSCLGSAPDRSFLSVPLLHSYPSAQRLEADRTRADLSLLLWDEETDPTPFEDALIWNVLGGFPTVIWSMVSGQTTQQQAQQLDALRRAALPVFVLASGGADRVPTPARSLLDEVESSSALDALLELDSDASPGPVERLRAFQSRWMQAAIVPMLTVPMLTDRGGTQASLRGLAQFLRAHGWPPSGAYSTEPIVQRYRDHVAFSRVAPATGEQVGMFRLYAPVVLGIRAPDVVVAADPTTHRITCWGDKGAAAPPTPLPVPSPVGHCDAQLSGDGQVVLSGWSRSVSQIRLQDCRTGKPWPNSVRSFSYPNEVLCVDAHHASGLWVMAGSCGGGHDGKVYLCERGTSSARHHRWFPQPVDAVAFSPDGTEICLATVSQCERLDTTNFERIATLEADGGCTLDIRYSADGRSIFTSDSRGRLQRRNLAGEVVTEYRTLDGGFLNAIDLHEESGLIAAWGKDCIHVWQLETAELLQRFPISRMLNARSHGPLRGRSTLVRSGEQMLLPYSGAAYQLCDIRTGARILYLSLGPNGQWVEWEDKADSDDVVAFTRLPGCGYS